MSYIIRHAEKLNSSVHAPLSMKGKEDAHEFGLQLQTDNIEIDLIISSPIQRCMQTAENIISGYQKKIPIIESKLLGDPGVYVNDDQMAMKTFETFELIEIINMQLSGTILDGFEHVDVASEKLLSYMQQQTNKVLYISHDVIITTFIHWLESKKKITNNDIVQYLGVYNLKKYLTNPSTEQQAVGEVKRYML